MCWRVVVLKNKTSFGASVDCLDLTQFTSGFIRLCPDCGAEVKLDDLVEGYDTICICPECKLKIYIGGD